MTAALDLLDRLLDHDEWTTGRVLAAAQTLSEAQLDQVFDLGHSSFRRTALHMVGNIEVWTDLLEGRPARSMPAATPTLPELHQRFDLAYHAFAQTARAARDAGRLNDLYWDVLDRPPQQKSVAGTLLHVITHNHMHRAELLHLLERLGVPDLIEGDVLSWEAAQT